MFRYFFLGSTFQIHTQMVPDFITRHQGPGKRARAQFAAGRKRATIVKMTRQIRRNAWRASANPVTP